MQVMSCNKTFTEHPFSYVPKNTDQNKCNLGNHNRGQSQNARYGCGYTSSCWTLTGSTLEALWRHPDLDALN